MGNWNWTREALVIGSLKSQGLGSLDIIELFKSDGLEGLENLARS